MKSFFIKTFITITLFFVNINLSLAQLIDDARTTQQTVNTDGSTLNITDNGSITYDVNFSDAVISTGNNVTITNNGAVATSGEVSDAVSFTGDNTTITNNGTITTINETSDAVDSRGADATITNNGSVIISGNDSLGISSNGASATITNNGAIVTKGECSDGVYSHGADVTITNNGTITTSGNFSNGIYSNGVNATITNNGVIIASGNSPLAIEGGANSQNVTLGTNSVTTGGIDLGTDNDSLVIRSGAVINGAIDMGDGTGDTVTAGSASSSKILISNAEALNIAAGNAGVVVNNTIHIIDPTSSAALTIGASNLSKTINNTVNSRVSNNQEGDQKSQQGKVWSSIFGSNFTRGADENNLAYDYDYHGIVVGYQLDKSSGFMIGVSNGEIKTKSQSFKSDVISTFAGYYQGLKIDEKTFINTNIIAGYQRYSNVRNISDNINGAQNAKSDINNLFISPSVELEHRIKLHESYEVRPNASVNYTAAFFGDATEAGAGTANLTVKKRNARILNARAGVSNILTLMSNYKISLGFGLESRNTSEDKVSAAIEGTDFEFATNNQANVTGHYINLGFKVINFQDVEFGLEIEKRSADGAEEQKSATLNANYKF